MRFSLSAQLWGCPSPQHYPNPPSLTSSFHNTTLLNDEDDGAQQICPLACSACLSSKNPSAQIIQSVICVQEAFLLPETATGAPGQHVQQVFWWLSSLGPEWIPSPSRISMVCASQAHVAALGPPALLSTPPVESIPRLFPADSPTRQFEFHIRNSGGEK